MHGHVSGTFSRSEIAYRRHYNKDIVKIDPTAKTFKKKCHYNKHAMNSATSSVQLYATKVEGKINFALYLQTYAALTEKRKRITRRMRNCFN
jgi:hypothetical protein